MNDYLTIVAARSKVENGWGQQENGHVHKTFARIMCAVVLCLPIQKFAGTLVLVNFKFGNCEHICIWQECIMRKEERGEERDMTTHLIKIQIFTHASRVTKFSPYELCTIQIIVR